MDPLNEVCKNINAPSGGGLTVQKIWDRGHVLDVTEEAIVFEVDRIDICVSCTKIFPVTCVDGER